MIHDFFFQMPELGEDKSWNFVEIDSASDLMAMENPRQSRTQVDHENRARVALQIDHNKNRERVALEKPGRVAQRSRELVRRKKGLRRRVRGQNKLRPLDNIGNKNDNKEKDILVQVNQSRLEEDNFENLIDSKERANQAKDPATPRHFEKTVVGFENPEEDNGSFPEGRSVSSRDYYPSGPRKEQLLENKRSFSTSVRNGEPNDRNTENDCFLRSIIVIVCLRSKFLNRRSLGGCEHCRGEEPEDCVWVGERLLTTFILKMTQVVQCLREKDASSKQNEEHIGQEPGQLDVGQLQQR